MSLVQTPIFQGCLVSSSNGRRAYALREDAPKAEAHVIVFDQFKMTCAGGAAPRGAAPEGRVRPRPFAPMRIRGQLADRAGVLLVGHAFAARNLLRVSADGLADTLGRAHAAFASVPTPQHASGAKASAAATPLQPAPHNSAAGPVLSPRKVTALQSIFQGPLVDRVLAERQLPGVPAQRIEEASWLDKVPMAHRPAPASPLGKLHHDCAVLGRAHAVFAGALGRGESMPPPPRAAPPSTPDSPYSREALAQLPRTQLGEIGNVVSALLAELPGSGSPS
mmetsp:Transcript_9118/g.23141  ORF Transcript_9118/g.23141 Transcript_9118/m.23141 type:complete len:279 (-) Transcript_9118:115-951(-)